MHSESRPSTPLSPEAIAQLVEGHREFLAFLERRVESRAIAEDILQTAFARGLERGSHVQEEKVVAWFYRVLRNSVIDHYRRRSTSARALEAWGREFTETEEPEAALRQEICQCVSGLLSTLKPEYRQALQVVDLEDGKLSDLAEQSGISAENAAVRVHRARKALRRQVERACGTCAEHGCFDCHCDASKHAQGRKPNWQYTNTGARRGLARWRLVDFVTDPKGRPEAYPTSGENQAWTPAPLGFHEFSRPEGPPRQAGR